MAWVVAVVLFAEAFGIAALNWFMGVVVDRQDMSLAGLDPDRMSMSAKAGAVVFGLYFALCGLVALLVAVRNRAPAGLGRVLLISVAVVHALLGAFAWGLIGPAAFVYMVVVLALVLLLLMTYDQVADGAGDAGARTDGGDGGGDGSGSENAPDPAEPEPEAKNDTPPAGPFTPPAPTTP
ncbi:hypothetical protein GCM10011578_071780 [Streptomyces fuscichromogenes]|uniref:Uncharacterized protein n=1 Tax=Streptomyces fuscichromogenes TaxID=1324013 RepID=A0A917XK52_9ACTN|nr:hypothetical protein GCM10011578_071780 [Streptomyces fuscichromogenes]